MMRCFLAIDLPETVRSSLAVVQFLLPLPRRVPVADLHLTLAFLDDQPEARLEAVHDELCALHLPAFPLELAGLGLFGGDRPRVAYAAVAANPALERLQRKVETAVRRAGIALPATRFVPHVTLGRFRPLWPDQAAGLENAVAAQLGFRTAPVMVRDFALIESHLHADGPRYEVLARYPLA